MNAYNVPIKKINSVVGFKLSKYYNLKEYANADDTILFYETKEELFAPGSKYISLYKEDLPKKYKKYSVEVSICKYFKELIDYKIYMYILLTCEEPFMHENTLKFELQKINLLIKLKKVLKENK